MITTDPPIEAPGDIIDAEIAAREANVRRWWRRAIALVALVSVASPMCAIIIWQLHVRAVREDDMSFPAGVSGPPSRQIKEYYRRYRDEEGAQQARGAQFQQLCAMIDIEQRRGRRRFTEEELRFYCGVPDVITEDSADARTFFYFYTVNKPRDQCVVCTLERKPDEPFMLSQVGYNATAAINIPTSKPAATRGVN
jgi:hypothetical protein